MEFPMNPWPPSVSFHAMANPLFTQRWDLFVGCRSDIPAKRPGGSILSLHPPRLTTGLALPPIFFRAAIRSQSPLA